MKYLRYLLVFIPLTIVGHFMEWDGSLMFFMSSMAIVPLAGYLGVATEEIACYTGPKMGGFLNATFGNATELIIAFFALKAGLFDVVKASLAGSVLGNILFVLGFSIVAGGIKHKELRFDAQLGRFTGTMLLFAVFGLCIPAAFTYGLPQELVSTKYESFSVVVAIVLLVIYVLGLIYSFKNQVQVVGSDVEEVLEANWSKAFSIVVLSIATAFIALESEILVKSIEPMTEALGIKKMFVGLILIPIIGNAAEHSTAVIMALKNKMDIAIEIAVGSSLQIATFVAPLLVLVSLFFTPMSIVFLPIELFIFAASVFIANRIVSTGKTTWIEGLLLLGVYFIVAVGFFII